MDQAQLNWITNFIWGNQAAYLLKRQLESQSREFLEKGGFTENLHAARVEKRRSDKSDIQFRMEQQGLKPKDLVPYIGSAPRVSEVLAGKRPLSLTMIRKLVKGLGIPAEVLLQERQRQTAIHV